MAELSADAYAALRAHLDSKDADTSSDDETAAGGAGVSEDFGMSQFWVRISVLNLQVARP